VPHPPRNRAPGGIVPPIRFRQPRGPFYAPGSPAGLDPYRPQLTGKPAEWCQLHPRQDDRLWSAQEVVEHLCAHLPQLQPRAGEAPRARPGHRRSRYPGPNGFCRWSCSRSARCRAARPRQFLRDPDQLHWPPMNGPSSSKLLRQEIDKMDSLIDQCRHRLRPAAASPPFCPRSPARRSVAPAPRHPHPPSS